jgi:hypothetical protein
MTIRIYSHPLPVGKRYDFTFGEIGTVAPASVAPRIAEDARKALSERRHGKPAHVWIVPDFTPEGEEIAVIEALHSFPEGDFLRAFVRDWTGVSDA